MRSLILALLLMISTSSFAEILPRDLEFQINTKVSGETAFCTLHQDDQNVAIYCDGKTIVPLSRVRYINSEEIYTLIGKILTTKGLVLKTSLTFQRPI